MHLEHLTHYTDALSAFSLFSNLNTPTAPIYIVQRCCICKSTWGYQLLVLKYLGIPVKASDHFLCFLVVMMKLNVAPLEFNKGLKSFFIQWAFIWHLEFQAVLKCQHSRQNWQKGNTQKTQQLPSHCHSLLGKKHRKVLSKWRKYSASSSHIGQTLNQPLTPSHAIFSQ